MVDMNLLEKGAASFGIGLTQDQKRLFSQYADFLVEYNQKVNLTAITSPEDIAIKHFVDSIALCQFASVQRGARVADVGSGAGFPGIPIKIIRPDISLTLIDSLNKRCVFQKELADILGINFDSVHMRAEDAGRDEKFRQKFTLVTARAVADLALLSEYCIPLVHIGGHFIAMKGPGIEAEVAAAKPAIKELGGRVENSIPYVLPDGSRRTVVIIEKILDTPDEYPRKGAAKNPMAKTVSRETVDK